MDTYEGDKLSENYGFPFDSNSNVNFLKAYPNCEFIDSGRIALQNDHKKDETSDNLSAILSL